MVVYYAMSDNIVYGDDQPASVLSDVPRLPDLNSGEPVDRKIPGIPTMIFVRIHSAANVKRRSASIKPDTRCAISEFVIIPARS